MPFKRFLPLFIFAALFIAFMVGLTLNPREVPSALIDKPAPDISLPPLPEIAGGLTNADLQDPDNIIIVNFFASWCGPCRIEHPALVRLGSVEGVRLLGIAYKDRPANSLSFLQKLGNPYAKVGVDRKGRAAIDWGVTGTPETFIIKDGIIRYQHIGPIYDSQVMEDFMPIIAHLRKDN